MSAVREAARAMLGSIFVTQGAQAVLNPERVVPMAQRFTDRVAPMIERTNARLPTDPRRLVQINGAIHLGAGLLLLTPLRRPAAAALAASLVPTTLAGHSFWQHEDAMEQANQRINFMKNLGLLGGLLLAAADTEGKPGLRWRTQHLTQFAGGAATSAAARAGTRAGGGAAKGVTKKAGGRLARAMSGGGSGRLGTLAERAKGAGRGMTMGRGMAMGRGMTMGRGKSAGLGMAMGRAKSAGRGKTGGRFARSAGKRGGWFGRAGRKGGSRWSFAR